MPSFNKSGKCGMDIRKTDRCMEGDQEDIVKPERFKKNTHSWYTVGMFLESRKENKGLDKIFSRIEEL